MHGPLRVPARQGVGFVGAAPLAPSSLATHTHTHSPPALNATTFAREVGHPTRRSWALAARISCSCLPAPACWHMRILLTLNHHFHTSDAPFRPKTTTPSHTKRGFIITPEKPQASKLPHLAHVSRPTHVCCHHTPSTLVDPPPAAPANNMALAARTTQTAATGRVARASRCMLVMIIRSLLDAMVLVLGPGCAPSRETETILPLPDSVCLLSAGPRLLCARLRRSSSARPRLLQPSRPRCWPG